MTADLHVQEALRLACDVRDLDPADIHAQLDRYDDQRLIRLAVTLAALVDVDRPLSELLDWTVEPPAPRPARTGPRTVTVSDNVRAAHNVYSRAKEAKVDPPSWCLPGEQAYQRAHYQRRLERRRALMGVAV